MAIDHHGVPGAPAVRFVTARGRIIVGARNAQQHLGAAAR